MTPADPHYRYCQWAAYFSVTAYLILSVIFAQERVILRDGANFTVGMINNAFFYLPLSRYAAYVNQLLPVIGIRAGLSLSSIILLYSINIALVYLAVLLCLDRFYRDQQGMIGLAVFIWVLTLETFFMPISELALGAAFVFLWLAQLKHSLAVKSRRSVIILAVISLHIVFSHPLVLFILLLIALHYGWRSAGRSAVPRKWIWIAAGAVGSLMAIKILVTSQSIYSDWSKIGLLENIFLNFKGLYLDQDTNYYFKKYLFGSHLNGLITLLFICGLLIYLRERKSLLIFLGCSGAYTAIYLITHPEFQVRLNMEVYFMVIAFYLAFYLAYISAHKKAGLASKAAVVFSALLIIVQISRVVHYRPFFTERNQILIGVLKEMKARDIQRAVVPFYGAPMKQVVFIGAVGHETLLLSKLEGPETIRSFVYILGDTIETEMIPAADRFLNNQWEETGLTRFRQDYFNLQSEVPYSPFYPEYRD